MLGDDVCFRRDSVIAALNLLEAVATEWNNELEAIAVRKLPRAAAPVSDGAASELICAQERGFAAAVAVLAQGARVLIAQLLEGRVHGSHFRTDTVVPRPALLVISKSSISRRTPGRPRPRPGPVE